VESVINDHYVPVKIHIKDQPQIFERFGVQWTPTMEVLDPDATKRHQFEGFLAADAFLAHLKLSSLTPRLPARNGTRQSVAIGIS
jgi:hypothetical protein